MEIHIAFIDYTRAVHKLNHGKLWDILFLRVFPLHLVEVIRGLYKNIAIKVLANDDVSRPMCSGVWQVSCLSPIFVNKYIDDLISKWKQLQEILKISAIDLYTILFADDQVIIANSEDDQQKTIYQLYTKAKDYNCDIKNKDYGIWGEKYITL